MLGYQLGIECLLLATFGAERAGALWLVDVGAYTGAAEDVVAFLERDRGAKDILVVGKGRRSVLVSDTQWRARITMRMKRKPHSRSRVRTSG